MTAPDTGLGYVVHVLLAVAPDGTTDEATQEFPTWSDAVSALDEIPSMVPGWQAITIYPTENFPRMMEGAVTRPNG